MKVFGSIDEAGNTVQGGSLALGNFDGIHRGHQALLKKAALTAGPYPYGVLTFTPHPFSLLFPHQPHFYLSCDEQRKAIFLALGLDVAIFQAIDRDFLQMSPKDFVSLLSQSLGLKNIIVGRDFSFGRDAKGDVALLEKLGREQGFKTHVVEDVLVNQQRCSSSLIRSYLSSGELKKANEMLGRPFSYRGVVVRGQGQGKPLGFATANLLPLRGLALAKGIYATVMRHHREGQQLDYLSATSVGTRPTVTEDPALVVETHCLDQDLELYGETIEVFFIARLRDEEKFSSIKSLQEQVQKDCQQVRQMTRLNPAQFHV